MIIPQLGEGVLQNYSFPSAYIFANVLKMSFPMDSIKGWLLVRLDKYFINFFDIATNKVIRGSSATLQTDHWKCLNCLRYVFCILDLLFSLICERSNPHKFSQRGQWNITLSENQNYIVKLFVFFTFMRRLSTLTCDFVPTSSLVIKNKRVF